MTFTAHDAVSYLIGADGNPNLAAHRATRELGVTVSPSQLLVAISRDPSAVSSLAQQVRMLAILRSIETFDLVHTQFRGTLDKLPVKDLANTYIKLLETMASFAGAGAPPPTSTPVEVILKALPPEIAESVEFFIKNPTASTDKAPEPPPDTASQLKSAATSTEAKP